MAPRPSPSSPGLTRGGASGGLRRPGPGAGIARPGVTVPQLDLPAAATENPPLWLTGGQVAEIRRVPFGGVKSVRVGVAEVDPALTLDKICTAGHVDTIRPLGADIPPGASRGSSLVLAFHDAVAGRRMLVRNGGWITVYVGYPAAEFHAMDRYLRQPGEKFWGIRIWRKAGRYAVREISLVVEPDGV